MDGQARWLESDINDWLFHPTESDSVDVALLRCGIAEQLDHNSIGLQGFATPDMIEQLEIGVGDDVFLTGLFVNHHGERKNIPIIRVGNIAAMPEEPIVVRDFGYMEAYLVEARSLGGISGSPVFVHISVLRALHLMPEEMRNQVTALDNVYYLLGLMHGHWDIMMQDRDSITIDRIGGQRVNMGIAIVVPASKIKEAIEQPMIRKSEDEKDKQAREAELPTADSIKSNLEFTRPAFEDALRRASRKVPEQESGESEN